MSQYSQCAKRPQIAHCGMKMCSLYKWGKKNSPHAQEMWSFCFLREGDCWGNSFNQLWILRYVPVSVDSRVWNLERSPKRKEMHIRRCLFVIACDPLRGYVDWIWYYRFTNVPHWSNKLSCLIVSLPPSPACSCAMLCFAASFALSIAFIHAYWCIPKFKQAFVCSLRVWKSLIISSCFALPKTHWVLYHVIPTYPATILHHLSVSHHRGLQSWTLRAADMTGNLFG